jgi:transposase, IS30 family
MASQLTADERDRIVELMACGFTQAAVAKIIGRAPSTISLELRRNSVVPGIYRAAAAQAEAERRRRERPLVRKMERPPIRSAVQRGLHHDWSPDQISGRLRNEHPDDPTRWISPKSIYLWIRRDEHRTLWESHLRRRGKAPYRRRKPVTPEHQRITGRDEIIERRGRIGDLEGDTVLGPPGTGGVLTLVDRLSRFLVTRKVHCKEAPHVATQLVESLNRANLLTVESITFDNGTEFADCPRVAEQHGFGIFFARAGAPYQRGTNENTNGLLRQYFPKGTRFDLVTAQQLASAATRINNRPRRCLGYKTPAEVLAEHSNRLRCISDS